MKTGITIALGLAAALGGCRKSDDKPPPASQPPAPPEPPEVRASQLPLPQLPALDLPADPKRDAKIELGHTLFFDPRLSANDDRACYSCHQNEDGNGGHDPRAIGSGGKPQPRHAPVIWDVAYFKSALYWDGRAPTLEANAKGAWGGGNMGVGADNLDKKAGELAAIPGYKKLFEAAGYGEVKADQVTEALADYERTLICKDTRYDRFAAGDRTAMTEQEQRGFDVFAGKGKCALCHAPPFFSSAMGVDTVPFFNIGIGTNGVPDDQVDVGRMKVTNQATDWGAFKPPSLRNITKSAPYFHDGSVAKLDDAVKLMAGGGIANRNKTALLGDAGLTDAERADLIAFLATLECPGKLEPPAKLP